MIQTPDFDRLYRTEGDPWRVATSVYEQRKLAVVLASLAADRYACAWDPACGIGELAVRLAARCTHVVATDRSEAAVEISHRRCAGELGIAVSRFILPGIAPDASGRPIRPDLVVLGEFMYYLNDADRRDTLAVIDASTATEVVAVHWRQHPHDAWLSGEAFHAELTEHVTARGWRHSLHHLDEHFVLDGFRR